MNHQTILIVDDNLANLKLIRLLLTQAGYTVRTATGAEEALQALSSATPDAILTDIQLPGINGLQLTRLIRSNPRTMKISILAVSANAMKENIQEAYDAGCDAYITKPIDTRTFASCVREYLDRGAKECQQEETNRELAPLRAAFLADCQHQVERLLNPPSRHLWRDDARDVLHRCAGMAGTFGYPQITDLARELETQFVMLGPDGLSNGLRRLQELLTHTQEIDVPQCDVQGVAST